MLIFAIEGQEIGFARMLPGFRFTRWLADTAAKFRRAYCFTNA